MCVTHQQMHICKKKKITILLSSKLLLSNTTTDLNLLKKFLPEDGTEIAKNVDVTVLRDAKPCNFECRHIKCFSRNIRPSSSVLYMKAGVCFETSLRNILDVSLNSGTVHFYYF